MSIEVYFPIRKEKKINKVKSGQEYDHDSWGYLLK